MNILLKKISYFLIGLLLICFIISSYTFQFMYPYGHLNDTNKFSVLYIITELVKLSGYLLLPLAICFNNKTSRNISKIILPIFSIISLFYCHFYLSISKLDPTLPFYNTNSLDELTLSIYNKINLFIPSWLIGTNYVLTNLLFVILSIIIYIQDKINFKDIKSLIYYPLFIILVLPFNLFDNLVRMFPKNVYSFLLFDNFTIWHFLMFIILILSTLFLYLYLRKQSLVKQDLILRALALSLMIHFYGRNSMLIGDGYNVYNTVFASIPLFICDIGKYIVFFAIMFKKKIFYNIAFFVHSAGALTVFFYFGKEGTHNYGTIFNYSFIYFTITHLLLFILSTVPVFLRQVNFSLKEALVPSLYYGVVILIATFTSVLVTNLSMTITTQGGETLLTPIYPNYAFSQICPVPVSFPTFLNITIGICEVNFFYEIILFITYVVLFFAFYSIYALGKFILQKYQFSKLKSLIKN